MFGQSKDISPSKQASYIVSTWILFGTYLWARPLKVDLHDIEKTNLISLWSQLIFDLKGS